MFTDHVKFEGFSAENWQRFVSLWKPRNIDGSPRTGPKGGLFAVVKNGRYKKLLHLDRGRLPLSEELPLKLGELAKHAGASWVFAWEVGALEECMERLGERMKPHHTFTEQSLLMLQIFREMGQEGKIEFYPDRLQGIPVPERETVEKALDTVCSKNKSVVLGLFQDGELFSFACLRRGEEGFDLLAGPERVVENMGLLSGDYRRDYRFLLQSVENLYGEVGFGLFAEASVFRRLQTDTKPGAWGRAVAVRDVIVSPLPPAMGVALGVDAARVAAEGLKSLTSRFDKLGIVDFAMSKAKGRVHKALERQELSHLLGFEPLSLLRLLLSRNEVAE